MLVHATSSSEASELGSIAVNCGAIKSASIHLLFGMSLEISERLVFDNLLVHVDLVL